MRPLPKTCPNIDRRSRTFAVRSTVSTDRPASVRQCIDFPATCIDHLLASAVLFVSSSPQAGDSVVQLHRLREEQGVVNYERDLSKADKLWQSLQLPHTPSPYCHARIFRLSRRALALPWG